MKIIRNWIIRWMLFSCFTLFSCPSSSILPFPSHVRDVVDLVFLFSFLINSLIAAENRALSHFLWVMFHWRVAEPSPFSHFQLNNLFFSYSWESLHCFPASYAFFLFFPSGCHWERLVPWIKKWSKTNDKNRLQNASTERRKRCKIRAVTTSYPLKVCNVMIFFTVI